MSSLSAKARSSAVWILLGNSLNRVLGMATMVVVARILTPDDFGIVSLGTAVWGLLTTVFATGVEAAVIHHQEHDPGYLDTAFWINLLSTACMMAATMIVAPLIEHFYRMPGVSRVIFVFAAGFFFTSFMQVHNAIISRELAFKTISVFNLVLQFLDSAGTIVLAVTGFGYWALVIPKAVLAPVKTVVWWKICGWRPHLTFSASHARGIFAYAVKTLGATLVTFININADYLILGKMLGQTKLGLYQMAYNAAHWPIRNFVFPMNNLVFPYFSRIKNDWSLLQTQYLKMLRLISLAAFPVFIGAVSVAPEAITLVLGPKWSPTVFAFQMLCLFGLIRSVGSPGGRLMMALGRPGLLLRFNVYQAPFLVGAIVFSVRYGISGVAVASLIVLGSGGIIFMGLTMRLAKLGYGDLLRAIAPASAGAGVLAAAVLAWRWTLYTISGSEWTFLFSAVAVGAAAYFITLALAFRPALIEAFTYFFSSMRDFKQSRGDSLGVFKEDQA